MGGTLASGAENPDGKGGDIGLFHYRDPFRVMRVFYQILTLAQDLFSQKMLPRPRLVGPLEGERPALAEDVIQAF